MERGSWQGTNDVVDEYSGTTCEGVANVEDVEGGEDMSEGGVLRWWEKK